MKFKIDFEIPSRPIRADWPKFYLLGSCFASNQVEHLRNKGFSAEGNPYGIIYNPVSISTFLYRLKEDHRFTEDDFVHYNQYFCLEHHGKFKFDDLQEGIRISNEIFDTTRKHLMESDVIVITYGTSLVFHNIVHKKIVANCHKLPSRDFELIQLQLTTLKNSMVNAVNEIKQLNPNAHVIFTVSPVRHLRSGVVESSRSKACLIAAVHEVLPDLEGVSYFPSYEIVIDELRDYRFTRSDMMHPTEQAQHYVLDRFLDTYLGQGSKEIMAEVDKFAKFAAHRPIGSTELHNDQVAERKRALKQKYPFLNIE